MKKIIDIQNGVVRTAYDDGSGGLLIKHSSDLTDFIEHTKAQFKENSGTTGWGDNPIDRKNKIASLPTEIINELNVKGIMRGYYIMDQKAMKKWLNDPDNSVFRTRGGKV